MSASSRAAGGSDGEVTRRNAMPCGGRLGCRTGPPPAAPSKAVYAAKQSSSGFWHLPPCIFYYDPRSWLLLCRCFVLTAEPAAPVVSCPAASKQCQAARQAKILASCSFHPAKERGHCCNSRGLAGWLAFRPSCQSYLFTVSTRKVPAAVAPLHEPWTAAFRHYITPFGRPFP
jgi:hypothetical protein